MRIGPDARPAFPQTVFVVVYSAVWIFAGVIVPALGGRLEQPIAILGFAAIPFAIARNPRASLAPPAAVSSGLAGLVGTYCLSFVLNGPDAYGATFVIALGSRVAFLWLGYVLLQNRRLLSRSIWILVGSSTAAAMVAFWQMTRLGIGIGRTSGEQLNDLMDPWIFFAFYSVQQATVGAILLIGLSGAMAPWRRVWFTLSAVGIFLAAYMSFFRREFLVTIPVILAVLWLSGTRIDRRSATVIFLAFVSLAVWEAARPESVIQSRLRFETGGFVNPEETRVVTARAQLEAIWHQPLGHGPGMHANAIAPYTPISEKYLSGFNIYGWLAVEGGVFCLLSYVLLLVAAFRLVWSARRQHGGGAEITWIRCGPALITQVALWGVFGNTWDFPLAWFVIGGILAACEIAHARPRNEGGPLGTQLRRLRSLRQAPSRGAPSVTGSRLLTVARQLCRAPAGQL